MGDVQIDIPHAGWPLDDVLVLTWHTIFACVLLSDVSKYSHTEVKMAGIRRLRDEAAMTTA
jgi:hypothetical protein